MHTLPFCPSTVQLAARNASRLASVMAHAAGGYPLAKRAHTAEGYPLAQAAKPSAMEAVAVRAVATALMRSDVAVACILRALTGTTPTESDKNALGAVFMDFSATATPYSREMHVM